MEARTFSCLITWKVVYRNCRMRLVFPTALQTVEINTKYQENVLTVKPCLFSSKAKNIKIHCFVNLTIFSIHVTNVDVPVSLINYQVMCG